MSDLHDLFTASDLQDADTLEPLQDTIRTNYLSIRSAILELATGARVSRVTISGKSTDFGQADLPQLRTLRDELANELRGLLDIGQDRVFRIKSSKGL